LVGHPADRSAPALLLQLGWRLQDLHTLAFYIAIEREVIEETHT